MVKKGSRRRITRPRAVKVNPIGTIYGDDLVLPNLSGITSHPEAINNFLSKSKDDTTDFKLTIAKAKIAILGVGDIDPDDVAGIFHMKSDALSLGPLVETTANNANAFFVFRDTTHFWEVGMFSTDQFNIKYFDTPVFKTAFTLTNAGVASFPISMTSAGFVKNTSGGILSGGNSIDISDDTNLAGGTNITLSGDTLNVDDAFLVNNAEDTGVGLLLTQDNSTGDTQYTAQVLHGTDATPPTASGFPIGTIYIQYTA